MPPQRKAQPDPPGHDLITESLATLPPRMRAVLVLRYAEDVSEAATAETLGCAVHTVRTRTVRGLARLRTILATRTPGAGVPVYLFTVRILDAGGGLLAEVPLERG